MRSSIKNLPGLTSAKSIIVPIVGLACLVLSWSSVDANEPLAEVIRSQATELNIASRDMRDEIKIHFRGTRGYGKMLAVNAQLKTRSAAVIRRIDRDPCYRALEKDVAKLNKIACDLSEAYENAMRNSREGRGQAVVGDTVHVIDKLALIIAIADQIKAASLGVDAVAIAPRGSEFVPNPNFAPAVSPANDEALFRVTNEQPVLEGPATTDQESTMRSVLEK